MHFRIAMEITRQAGRLPEELIIKGYRYSQYGPVAFVLNGVGTHEINKTLDPIVPTLPLNIPGVKYIDLKARAIVCETIIASKAIIAISPAFVEAVKQASQFVGKNDVLRVIQRPGYLEKNEFRTSRFSTISNRARPTIVKGAGGAWASFN
ncbi:MULTISPECIES: hypothetical protein [Rhizobium]|uniref:hypothetical protein n=1 Tax=Rhizobium TaxID=379 RepID=UPI001C8303CA|nr:MULTISPECIES: hypothetical protein [Rhizobium]MBX4893834.1 hypothetical protein [Rhizobium bangladeshense]MBX5014453.1 hypothetical protein [Rhizobium lentis]